MINLKKLLKVNQKVYIRECFNQIWEEFIKYERRQIELQINHPDRIAHAYLTGTPGIGKTTFLTYFIDMLLKDNRQVVFGSRDITGFIYWKSQDEYELIEEHNIVKYLTDSSIFFVIDSRDIKSTLGPCLICSSPRTDIAKQFRKTAKKLYMPVWDWHEIQQLHELIYMDVLSKDHLAARFYLLGGVPRLLFDQIEYNAADIVKSAIENSPHDHLRRLQESKGPSAPEELSHRLIHQDSVNDASYKYASPYVTSLVLEKCRQNRHNMVIYWLDEISSIGKAGGPRGNLFEDIGHQVLTKGGSFLIRELDIDQPEFKITIPSKELQIVTGPLDNLKVKDYNDQYYYKPLSKIFECIDSCMVINGEMWGFHFSVSKSHKISTAVYWLYKYLNLRHYVTVVYDEDYFKQYKTTSYMQSQKEPFKNDRCPSSLSLKQYVLLIDQDSAVVNLSSSRAMLQAEFKSFVKDEWTEETKREYKAAFE